MSTIKTDFMLHGADYNYEQWLDYPEILDQDFELMKAANCNVMNVGIFSWAMLEPDEDVFNFDWLDGLMDRLAENGLYAILATPSGAKPAWMSQKYSEIRMVDADGHRQPHRTRHNHCRTSPIYRRKVRQMNTLLAERYAQHPALLMWHVSNEYNSAPCYCEFCLQAFREWLQRRYQSLEQLNKAWWTNFWSHRFTDWSQIEPVDPSIHGLMLDWKRFTSDQVLDFYLAEIEPLRKFTPEVPVTTNFMQPDVGLDYWVFAPHVDVIAWDSYPRWHSEADEWRIAVRTAFYHDLHRSYKQKPFLLMESTPSVTNWQGISRPKEPGMHLLSSLQAVAHGANGVGYFQWRQSRGGEEKFHGAVVGHAGHKETRTFQEVTAVGALLHRLKPIVESINHAEVAIVYDFQNEWALDLAQLPRSQDKNYQQRCQMHYQSFWQRGMTADIVNSTFDQLEQYKLLIVPMLYMVPDGVAQRLSQFVNGGGTLVATYLTGLVNDTDLTFMRSAPGPLQELLGIWVEETDALYAHDEQSIRFAQGPLSGSSYPVKHYADLLHPQGADVLAEYEQEYCAGWPAVTVNQFGSGRAYYLAGRYDERFLNDFYGWLAGALSLSITLAASQLPRGVTAQVRRTDTETYVFLLNFEPVHQTVPWAGASAVDFFSGQAIGAEISLTPYGYQILQIGGTA